MGGGARGAASGALRSGLALGLGALKQDVGALLRRDQRWRRSIDGKGSRAVYRLAACVPVKACATWERRAGISAKRGDIKHPIARRDCASRKKRGYTHREGTVRDRGPSISLRSRERGQKIAPCTLARKFPGLHRTQLALS